MLCFPQLESGALTQFPLRRWIRKRTICTRQADGRVWKLSDWQSQQMEWEMELSGLTAEELEAIEALFRQVEGRRDNFVFLDPADNLLTWSEDLQREAWARDPYMEVRAGIGDPLGTNGGAELRNSGPVPQCVQQALAVPGWFQYCLSLWVRSREGHEVTLFARSGTAASTRTVRGGTSWQRVVHPVRLACSDELVRFGLELAPGASAEVFGIQVEAQCGASAYKKTTGRGGVYPEARFSEDVLAMRAEAPNYYCSRIRIVSRI